MFSALTHAIQKHSTKTVRMLLRDHPTLLLKQNENKETPLELAVYEGHLEIVKLILAYDGKPHTLKKSAALLAAVEIGQIDCVRSLLAAGAIVEDDLPPEGVTPLIVAVQNGRDAIIPILLDAGADKYRAANDGFSAIALAANYGYMERLNLLLQTPTDFSLIKGIPPIAAATSGHQKACIRHLHHAGASVHATLEDGSQALSLAAQHGYLEELLLLLVYEADVNHTTTDGYSPLMFAAANGHDECVLHLLLESKIKINQDTARDGGAAVNYAAHNGHLACLQHLISAGADINHPIRTGFPPISQATQLGHIACVEALLDAGVEINQSFSNNQHSLLTLAAAAGKDDCVQLLVKRGINLHHKTKSGCSAVSYAAYTGHASTLNVLIELGASTSGDSLSADPAFIAVEINHLECLQLLTQKGVDLDKTISGCTLVHHAAYHGSTECLAYLLTHSKLHVNTPFEKSSPLATAIRQKHTGCVYQLIDAGADVKQRSHNDLPLIALAARAKSPDIIQRLLHAGADPRAHSEAIWPPLLIAAQNNDLPSMSILLQHLHPDEGAFGTTALCVASSFGSLNCMQALLSANADPCLPEKKAGRSPLSMAAESGQVAVLKLLLNLGVSLEKADANGYTPTSTAAYSGEAQCLELLLNAGADCNKANLGGESPLYIAATRGHLTCLEVLLSAGADLSVCQEEKNNPLLSAIQYGHHKCAHALLNTLHEGSSDLQSYIKALSLSVATGDSATLKPCILSGLNIYAQLPGQERTLMDYATPEFQKEMESWVQERMYLTAFKEWKDAGKSTAMLPADQIPQLRLSKRH